MRLGIPQSLENKGKLGQLVDKQEFNELTVLLHFRAESLGIVVVYLAVSICHLNFYGTPEPIVGIRCTAVAQQVSAPVIAVITRLPDITCHSVRVDANCGGLFQFRRHPVRLIRPPVQFLNPVTAIMAVCFHDDAVRSVPLSCQSVSCLVVTEFLREQSPRAGIRHFHELVVRVIGVLCRALEVPFLHHVAVAVIRGVLLPHELPALRGQVDGLHVGQVFVGVVAEVCPDGVRDCP